MDTVELDPGKAESFDFVSSLLSFCVSEVRKCFHAYFLIFREGVGLSSW